MEGGEEEEEEEVTPVEMVVAQTGCDAEAAKRALSMCGGDVVESILMISSGQVGSSSGVVAEVAKEEQEMLAQEARRVGEQATKIAKEEAERRSKESAERKLKEDAERKAAHLAALKAKEETERMACAICHAQLQAGGSHARAPACTECGRTSLCMACVKNALLSSRGEKEKRPVCVQCLDKIAKQRSEPPRAEPQSAHDGLSLFLFGVVVVVAAASLGYAVIRTRREGNHE